MITLIIILLCFIPLVVYNRLIGTGILPRFETLTMGASNIGLWLSIMTQQPYIYSLLAFIGAFILARSIAVGNGLGVADGTRPDKTKDSFTTGWITWITSVFHNDHLSAWLWGFIRASVFYSPLFFLTNSDYWREAAIGFGIIWPTGYAISRPVYKFFGWKQPSNFTTNFGEWFECVGLAIILITLSLLRLA